LVRLRSPFPRTIPSRVEELGRGVLTYFFLLLVLLLNPRNSWAQEYVFEKGDNSSRTNAQTIKASRNIQYIYAQLGKGEYLTDYYNLSFTEFEPGINIELLISDRGGPTFRPDIIFIDPHARDMIGDVPSEFPANATGRVYDWEGSTGQIVTDKTISQSFVQGPQFIVKNTSNKQYGLAVFDPQGVGGRYVIKIGNEKSPSTFMSLLNNLLALIRIKLNLY
jgi:hypothetical protein